MSQPKIRFAYRAGFRRLWVVASLIWMILVAYMVLTSIKGFDLKAFFLMLGPPIVIYLAGVVAAWVIEGFAKAD